VAQTLSGDRSSAPGGVGEGHARCSRLGPTRWHSPRGDGP
jgi:hypothetical protein